MCESQEHTFTFDGSALFYRAWLPASPAKRGVLLFHRGHEHSGRLQVLVDGLDLPDYAFFAWDARGHGRSPGERGEARHFMDLVRDVEAFTQHVRAEYQLAEEDLAVIAHSLAAVVVGLWAHDYAPRIRALVLATPALLVKLYVPLAIQGLRAVQEVTRRTGGSPPPIQSYVKGSWLTHDKHQASIYDNDPLVSKRISVNVLVGLFDGAARLVADGAALSIPTQILCARRDWVVANVPSRRLFRAINNRFKEIKAYRDFFHALFHEEGRERVFADVRKFVEEAFERPVDRSQLVDDDRWGPTREEYEFLKAGLPILHPRRWLYAGTQVAMKTLGRLSRGIRLGLKTGFASGQTLDYVYANEPRGHTPLGRFIDRVYLNAIGWRCVRVRKQNLEELITLACELRSDRKAIQVVDVAGGPGRYLIDLVPRLYKLPLQVLVRDQSLEALAEGRALATSLGLSDRIAHEQGDAFSRQSLAGLGTEVDVAVVSGLWELFDRNQPLQTCLEGLSAAVPAGGYLVYTNQPWHPQIEQIAELLTDQGQPWVMRRRSQAEVDELVRQAGFDKVTMRIDDEGIFTVSLARRR